MRPRVNACMILHYGLEYVAYAVQSVYPVAERIEIAYTPRPSHGHSTAMRCPDSGDLLWREVRAVDPDGKVSWTEGIWGNEAAHRDFAVERAMLGADMVVVVDADEVWDLDGLRLGIRQAAQMPQARYRVPFVHLWRSFAWACTDSMMPVRILKAHGDGENSLPNIAPVYHFGYAQKPAIVAYKQAIHGHKSEWREGWFEGKFLAWRPGMDDVHPTAVGIWNPRPFGKRNLPLLMRAHPYRDMEIIA